MCVKNLWLYCLECHVARLLTLWYEDKASSTVTDSISKVHFDRGNKNLGIFFYEQKASYLQQAKFWWWEGIVGYFVSEFYGRRTRGDRSLQQVTVTTPLFEQAIFSPCDLSHEFILVWIEGASRRKIWRRWRYVLVVLWERKQLWDVVLSVLSFRFHKMLLYLGLSSSVAKNTKVKFHIYLLSTCSKEKPKFLQ